MGKTKLSIRLSDNQMLVLKELKEKLHCSYSVMVRSIVLNFLTQYEDVLDRIITGEQKINFENWNEDDD